MGSGGGPPFWAARAAQTAYAVGDCVAVCAARGWEAGRYDRALQGDGCGGGGHGWLGTLCDNSRMRILVIEDDEDLADALVRRLRRLGHAVDCQKDGLSADGVLQYETFDLVILDIGLPRMSGFEILHRLRDRGSKTPVLALTARIDIEDRVHALDTGADDYLAKPFDFRELEARCRALLRRPSVQAAGVLRFGDLVIDSAARQVSLAGQRIDLPKREYSLLEILLGGMNRAVSKAEIANKLFAFDDDAAPNAIEVYIARLRRKLEGSPLRIETQRGTGYLLKAVEDADADAAPRD